MRIIKLELISFGAFSNKVVDLSDGLNILYGPNEAGKSTLHKFIEGMFFGFFYPHLKNKRYTPDYERFLPWRNKGHYIGSMIFETQDGKRLRIERDFHKTSERVDVFDDRTGAKLTKEYVVDVVKKLPIIHEPLLHMSETTFKNTVCIGQLDGPTDSEFAKEIKDLMLQFGQTQDLHISTQKFYEQLEKEQDLIGSESRKKSHYGTKVSQKQELEVSYEEAKQRQLKAFEYREKLNDVSQHLKQLEVQETNILSQMTALKNSQLTQASTEEAQILQEANQLSKQLMKARQEVQFGQTKIQQQAGEIEEIHRTRTQMKKQSEQLRAVLEVSDGHMHPDRNNPSADMATMDEPIAPLFINKGRLLVLAYIVLIGLGIVLKDTRLFLSIAAVLLTIALSGLHLKQWASYQNRWQSYARYQNEKRQQRQNITVMKQEQGKAQEEWAQTEQELKRLDAHYLKLQSAYKMAEEKQEALTNQLAYFKRQEMTFLETYELDQLENLSDYLFKRKAEVFRDQYEALERALTASNEQKVQFQKQVAAYETQMSHLEMEGDTLAAVEKDLADVNDNLEQLNHKKETLTLMASVMDQVTKTYKNPFAPLLNQKVSQWLEVITKGRYQSVKVDEALNVWVLEEETRQMVAITQLSRGTLDLFYLALRIAISELIHAEDPCPLILDEPFAHFDDERLSAALGVLESLNRQVILFSCQRREAQMAPQAHVIDISVNEYPFQ